MAQINDLLVLGNSNLLGSANIMGTLTNNGKKISPDEEIIPMIVNVTADSNNAITSLSHTTAEMRAAVNAGRVVLCKYSGYTTMWGTKVAVTVFGYYSWNEYVSDGHYEFYFTAWQGDAKYYINITDTLGRCTLTLLSDYINPNNYNTFKINTTTASSGGSGSSGSNGVRSYTTITPDSAEATLTINLDGIEAVATDTNNTVLLKPMAGTGITVDQLGIHHYKPTNSTINNLTANGRKYVTGLTFDSFGHVTGYTTGTETVVAPTNMTAATASAAGTAGLVPAPAKGKQTAFLRGDATWAALPTASTSAAGIVTIGSNISVSSGTISVPAASDTTAGVTIVYPAAKCTTYTTDSGTVTPAAVKQAVDMFSLKVGGNVAPASGATTGHIYLTGAKESSSTGNTTQIVFGTASNEHVALTSNQDMIVINPSTTVTTGQILLKLTGLSTFPKGIQANVTGNLTGTADKAKDLTDTLAVSRGGTGHTSLADSTPTTARYRGSSLHSTSTNPTIEGAIAWQYE